MMKYTRVLYIIGLVLVSACSKSEVDKPVGSISFAPVAAKATKAIIAGTTYPVDESFVVSAYRSAGEAYFEDLTAAYSSSMSLWETTDAQFWPLGGSLDFIAYSPASAGLTIASGGVSAESYTITTAAQMTTDLCYASASVADCANHPDSVPLTFSHALSQVVFRVKAAGYYSTASSTVTLSMTSLALKGIYSVGDLNQGTWENLGSEHNYTLSGTPTVLTYNGSNQPETVDVCAYLFLPQELGPNAAISVGYNIVQRVSGTDYTLENTPVTIPLGSSLTQWEPGKKYIYTLNIGMNNVITFTASTVGWQDDGDNIIVEEN